MDEDFDFDGFLGSLDMPDFGEAPSFQSQNMDFSSLFNDVSMPSFTAPDLVAPALDTNYFQPTSYLPDENFLSANAAPQAAPAAPAEKGMLDYAKEYGPYLLAPNPLAAILVNKLSGAASDYFGGGTAGNLASTGTSSLLSGATPQQALVNAAMSEVGNQTSQGISSLMPQGEDQSLAQQFLNRAAPNVGSQLVTALLTGNAGSLAPMVRSALLNTGKGMASNKVFGSLTGD
jgi:hypothetical protein